MFLVLIVIGAVTKERANLGDYFREVSIAAIGMEIGIHNATLAIAIASSPRLLNNSTMAIPPAIYSLIMFVTAAGFGYLANARAKRAEP